ncbi:MAG: cytochrome c [Zoogloeaceae bacterium]|nr:cytochrome c [Zoogloeaceae bacterium]
MGVMTTLAGLAAIGAGVVMTGAVSVAADEPHSEPVHQLLALARSRAVGSEAADIDVPPLDDAAGIRRGAGNYAAMCATCHLQPGSGPTELSAGLYPAPPDLSTAAPDPARAFWIIKHGIKASGMPAWGTSMSDAYLWDMVAFLQRLPAMSPEDYLAEVAASDGHAHGGGEHMMEDHQPVAEDDHHAGAPGAHDGAADHHAPAQSPQAAAVAPAPPTHIHPDGKRHEH